ncbi:MAG TPA: c-type cytochrome [Nitrospira sp.]|nr:c-type cytochrome [Nitrospira sp.]
MRRTLLSLLAFTFLLACTGAGWVGYRLLTTGFSAKTDPHPLEVMLARRIRALAIPSEQWNAPNPIPVSRTVLQESLAHFADHCATCHANDGSGQTPIGRNVYPKAPDLRLDDTQSMPDGALFFIIHHGIRFTAMPAWGEGDPEKDLESWKLVHFIRHLPQLTPEELDQMKALNPKTTHQRDAESSPAGLHPTSDHHH